MANNQMIKPVLTDEGLEFYSNGKERGMSISSLAKLCGVDRKAIQTKLKNLAANKTTSFLLEPFCGKSLELELNGGQKVYKNARLIVSEVSAAIIMDYATRGHETAQFSMTKFSVTGIDFWIDELTGVKPSGLNETAEEIAIRALQDKTRLLEENKALTEKAYQLTVEKAKMDEDFYKATVRSPGIKDYFEAMAEKDLRSLKACEDDIKLTAWEWLKDHAHRGLLEDDKFYRRFRLLAAETYKSFRSEKPQKQAIKNTAGNWATTYVYSEEDYPILSIAYGQAAMEAIAQR